VPRKQKDKRSGKDGTTRQDSQTNQPEYLRLVDELEAMRESLSQKHRATVETQDKIADETVRLKFDFECSEGFARDLINGIVHIAQGKTRQEQLQDPQVADDHLVENTRLVESSPEESPLEKHTIVSPSSSGDSQQETECVYPTPQKRILPILFITLLVIATAIGGFKFITYKRERTQELAIAQQTRKNQELYEQYLASSLDLLLAKLDQLISTPKMTQVFPEISSLPAIARFKRGPDAADKAIAAKEFIYRVKTIFDNWVARSNDFPLDERPGKKEITYFLTVWTETEPLLNQLEAAKNAPSIVANTSVETDKARTPHNTSNRRVEN